MLSDMLEKLKEDVIRIGRQAQRDGLCKHKAGNFSICDRNTGYVVITPSGVDREELTVEDMIVMDLDARVITCKSGLKPRSFLAGAAAPAAPQPKPATNSRSSPTLTSEPVTRQ